MAEPMTVELLAEAYWKIQGYMVQCRWPYPLNTDSGHQVEGEIELEKGTGGYWSDVDVIGYQPDKQILSLTEVKVQDSRDTVYVYPGKDAYKMETSSPHPFIAWAGDWLKFMEQASKSIRHYCSQYWDSQKSMSGIPIKKIIFLIISNGYVSEDIWQAEQLEELLIREKIKESIDTMFDKEPRIDIQILRPLSTNEALSQILARVETDSQGKRYGQPILDLAREIVRYRNPSISRSAKGLTLKSRLSDTALADVRLQMLGKTV